MVHEYTPEEMELIMMYGRCSVCKSPRRAVERARVKDGVTTITTTLECANDCIETT